MSRKKEQNQKRKEKDSVRNFSRCSVTYEPSGMVLAMVEHGFVLRDRKSDLVLIDASDIATSGRFSVNSYTTIRDAVERPHHVYQRAAMVQRVAVFADECRNRKHV